MKSVLLVEDDPDVAKVLRLAFEDSDFDLCHAATLAQARHVLQQHSMVAVLLDLNLPDGNGRDLCLEIRRDSTLPILILTARRDEFDRVLGLEIGADDYIVKPFSPREVLARLRAVLRRQGWAEPQGPDQRLLLGQLTIDAERHEVWVADELVSLTRVEFRLLETLAQRPGRVFSREEIIAAAWDGDFIQDRVVDSVVSRLRRKLGDRAPAIRTVHGVGYAIRDD